MSTAIELVHWPWWLGGMALGTVAVLHLAFSGRLLTVSGILARALRWRVDDRDRAREIELAAGGLDAELLAATRAQFGDIALPEESAPGPEQDSPCSASPRVRLPISAGVTFVVALTVGGYLAAQVRGRAPGTGALSLGNDFETLVGTGAVGLLAALLGGFLVGFGGRMAGGCTSGHGLSGIGRLQVGSVAATAAFFAGGAAVSFLLRALQ